MIWPMNSLIGVLQIFQYFILFYLGGYNNATFLRRRMIKSTDFSVYNIMNNDLTLWLIYCDNNLSISTWQIPPPEIN